MRSSVEVQSAACYHPLFGEALGGVWPIHYADFSNTHGLVMAGTYNREGGFLTLGGPRGQAGAAWFGVAVSIVNGFDCVFRLVANPQQTPPDGLTFCIQPSWNPGTIRQLGEPGDGLGCRSIPDGSAIAFRRDQKSVALVRTSDLTNVASENRDLAGFWENLGSRGIRILYSPYSPDQRSLKVFVGNLAVPLYGEENLGTINPSENVCVGFTASGGFSILEWLFRTL